MNYLVTYRPLIVNRRGKPAVENYGIPPFVDHSCRREPDFESQFPSITAICRKGKFAPRLRESDTVVYMTVKGNYEACRAEHWRLTSILRVMKRFESHEQAAEWYIEQDVRLPSNCLIRGNPPLQLDQTNNYGKHRSVKCWDAGYRKRVREYPVFLACNTIFLNLNDPPVVTRKILCEVFGKIPGTRTPPRITNEQLRNLIQRVGIRIDIP